MAINNYELVGKPYTRGLGDNLKTVVEIRLEDGTRYSTNMRELTGDRTNEQEDVLIQAVLDIIKAELDPGSAIVKAQAEIKQAVQTLAKTNTDLTANIENLDNVSAITEVLIALAIGQNGGMPTNTYSKVAQFIKPLVKDRRYTNDDIVSMPYPYDTNPKWPKETPTILKFQMQPSEGYTWKEQPLAEMLQKGILTVVMPRIE
ncbi:hypothetical protein ATE37_01960 [Streptococcus oralis subsp. tigurinus]|uniref:Phage protein n=1 Tax=Streptococcus oralis subsp. tigurinus TaxID=1077464 RepID=A0A1X0WZ65_STROR|nr:hypothetical protein [Streptococcus oralis]ORJ32105.1 hypothetical protein ATE37_01960 [Streptococcus oralis subsp. tigurinus]